MNSPRQIFSLLLSISAAAFLALANPLHQDGDAEASQGQATASLPGQAFAFGLSEATRRETFALFPRDQRWESKRQQLGTARLVGKSSDAESAGLIEFELKLNETGTHIQRTQRCRPGELGTYVYREWRTAGPAGRSLVMEKNPAQGAADTALLREWAGGNVRHQGLPTPSNGLTLLSLIERERDNLGSSHEVCLLPIFDDQASLWSDALVVRTPVGFGPSGHLRIVDIFPTGGGRHSRWVFGGTRLLGFLHGQYEAIAVAAPEPVVAVLDADL